MIDDENVTFQLLLTVVRNLNVGRRARVHRSACSEPGPTCPWTISFNQGRYVVEESEEATSDYASCSLVHRAHTGITRQITPNTEIS